jgi:hypothetical protein
MRKSALALVLCLDLAACSQERRSGDLARDSGVAGAGTGASTQAARAPSPPSTGGEKTDSTQSNQGAYAGGPHG